MTDFLSEKRKQLTNERASSKKIAIFLFEFYCLTVNFDARRNKNIRIKRMRETENGVRESSKQ